MKLRRRRYLSEEVSNWMDTADTTTMSDIEEYWHKVMTSMLLNKKGKWGPYQHALYALRFQDFILKIVPLSVDPHFTACVVFDEAVIYVGEGFLVDEKKYFQLNVIIRHELAHVLLRHQIRMMAKIGELPYSKISTSQSLHELINIIADFEISNKKYTTEDKKIVLDMYLNGKLVGGLVTEAHREAWMRLPIEEMYEKISEELDKIASDIADSEGSLDRWSDTARKIAKNDMITTRGTQAIMMYSDRKTPSIIWAPIEKYFATSKQFASCDEAIQKYILEIYANVKDLSKDELSELLLSISTSKAFEFIEVTEKFELNTPEQKFWAMQVIKTLLGNSREKPKVTIKRAEHSKEYKDAYNKVIRACGRIADCSEEELAEIFGAVPRDSE